MTTQKAPNWNPNGQKAWELPAQQAAFDEWAHEKGLLFRGSRRWKNISERNTVRMHFHLSIPPHLHPERLHRTVRDPMAEGGERSIDLWPPSERGVFVLVAPLAECSLPELWSNGVITVRDNVIIGGECPAFMRPVGVLGLKLHEGFEPSPPEAA
jgi:hypothetical protein